MIMSWNNSVSPHFGI